MIKSIYPLLLLFALLNCPWALGQTAYNGEQAAGTQPAVHFCFTDQLLQKSLQNDPSLQTKMDLDDQAILREMAKRNGQANFLIPVVVYVVHNNGPENISDQQVQSQIIALNDVFDGRGISFCLATEENGTPLPGSTANPGIIRIQSAQTNHDVADEATLKAFSNLPSSRYLRIWVVNDITASTTSGTINGYARLPAAATPALDGIVMRASVFGDLATCGGCTMAAGYGEGDILAHEVGHYLNLHHTFYEGCAGMTTANCGLEGDRVCDTPPVAAANNGCPTGANSCAESPDLPDLINNFMDYTSEACMNDFTTGQENRMHASINMYRSLLVSGDNHTYTGVSCAGNLVASINTNNNAPCIGTSVQFQAGFISGATYAWDFGDGTTGTGLTVNHTYTAAYQPAYVTLTVDDGTNAVSTTTAIFVENCSPIQSEYGHWYFGRRQGLDFSSGAPVYDPAALNNNTMSFGSLMESAAVQSDASGNLLFYSDGISVWNSSHQLINSGTPLLGDQSSLQGVLSVPDPANSNEYYLFTSFRSAASGTPHYGLRYSKVVVTGGAASMGAVNVPIAAPAGYVGGQNGALITREGIAAGASCNGYWLVCASENPTGRFLLVFEVTASGIALVSDFQAIGPGNTNYNGGVLNLQFAPNGNRLAVSFYASGGALNKDLAVYDFDKFSGTISNEVVLSNDAPLGLSFSPNSQFLYTVQQNTDVLQYDVTAPNPATSSVVVGGGMYGQMQIGPDDKIYITRYNSTKLGVIHRPDVASSTSSPNACFFSASGPLMQTGNLRLGLPNFINATDIGVFSNSFSYTQSSCLEYNFFPDVCGSNFQWNFGDPASGASNTSTATFPSHTFSGPGSYVVTLTVTGGPTITETIEVGIAAPTINGPLCDVGPAINNYSVNAEPNVNYSWTATGGTILSLSNTPMVEVDWNTFPGTISVTATNSLTGCTITQTETVEEFCGGACPNECKIDPKLDLVKKEGCSYDFNGFNAGVICPSQMYQWQVYDATTSVLLATIPGQTVNYTFPASGTYKVCLEIFVPGPNGTTVCKESDCTEIRVECPGCERPCDLKPVIRHNFPRSCFYQFQGINDGTVCPNQFYQWTVFSATGMLLAVIDGQNISYALPGSGTYKVCLTIFETNDEGEVICKEQTCIELKRTCVNCEKVCDLKPDFSVTTEDNCSFQFNGVNNGAPCYTQVYRWEVYNAMNGLLVATLYGQQPSYTFVSPASNIYTVCLEIFVLDENGKIKCIEKKCRNIRVRCRRSSLRQAAEEGTGLQVNHQPNPASFNASFWLNVESEALEAGQLRIVNVKGVVVREQPVSAQGSAQISTTGLAPGIYFYYVEVNGQLSNVEKLVIVQRI
ncbi:MAG: PKD domain-containing protein [Salibacteraceae bacterium]